MLARIALELFERTRLHAQRVLLSAQEIEIQSVEVSTICDLFLRRLTTRNAIVVLIFNRLLNLNDPLVGEFHERCHKRSIRHLGVADVHKGSNSCRVHTLRHVAEIRILEYRGRLLFQQLSGDDCNQQNNRAAAHANGREERDAVRPLALGICLVCPLLLFLKNRRHTAGIRSRALRELGNPCGGKRNARLGIRARSHIG